jgi:hypothetical protein
MQNHAEFLCVIRRVARSFRERRQCWLQDWVENFYMPRGKTMNIALSSKDGLQRLHEISLAMWHPVTGQGS